MNENQFNRNDEVNAVKQHLSFLATDMAVTQREHAARENSLEILPGIIEQFNLNELPIDFLATAYMMCSYGITQKKHNIKPSINRIFRREMEQFGLTDDDTPRPEHAKPVAMIVTTWFTTKHAVHRCFGKSLAGLKRQGFEVVQLALNGTDPATHYLFDRVVICDMQAHPDFITNIEHAAIAIKKVQPNIIIYADIAMHPMGVFLSNLRLAPIQVSMPGHPVSAYSPMIDHMVVDDSMNKTARHFTEVLTTYPKDEYALVLPHIGQSYNYTTKDTRFRVLIPGTCPKLNRPFLQACAKIMEEMPDCALHVTTNAGPDQIHKMQSDINQVVSAEVYGHLTYKELSALIASCEMFLMPFPFAGTNLTVDCLMHGLPGIIYEGDEMMSATAATIMRRFGGNTDELIVNSMAEYIEKAVKLGTSHKLRQSLRLPSIHNYPEFADNMDLFAPECDGFARTIKRIVNEYNLHP